MLQLRPITPKDCQIISSAFARIGWNKPISLYESYVKMQARGERDIIIAEWGGNFAGYLTIKWQSDYLPFQEANIPEVNDFNVLPAYRRQSIGTQLMDKAEQRIALRSSIAGIGVGLTPDYMAAFTLYIRRGYLPEGQGICYQYDLLKHGDMARVDDDLNLFFTKQLVY